MLLRYLVLVGLSTGLMLAVLGCGGKDKPVKVEGIVTLDGKPLADATVVFDPVASDGRLASGRTNTEGRFRLGTFATGDGALAGDYKVTVSQTNADALTDEFQDKLKSGNMSIEDQKNIMGKAMNQDKAKAKSKTASPIPAVYSTLARTPLHQRVPADGEVRLELESSAR